MTIEAQEAGVSSWIPFRKSKDVDLLGLLRMGMVSMVARRVWKIYVENSSGRVWKIDVENSSGRVWKIDVEHS